MRPLAPADGPAGLDRDRGHDTAALGFSASPTASMSCFLTTESELDAAEASQPPPMHPWQRKAKTSACPSRRQSRSPAPSPTPSPSRLPSSVERRTSPSRSSHSVPPSPSSTSSPSVAAQVAPPDIYSQPLTPLSFSAAVSAAQSVLSSTSSRRASLTLSSIDFQESHVASSAVSQTEGSPPLPRPHYAHHPSFATAMPDVTPSPESQLIMPSLVVPHRRPFSKQGQSIGKLKLLVAGRKGIGKTSLIHAIARSSEHVVHIDSSTTPASTGFEEIHASTRSQPWWAADTGVNGQASGRRRVSMQTEVLDRNICFVDVLPSHPSSSTALSYVERHFEGLSRKSLNEHDSRCLISSGSTTIVDAALYILPHQGPSPEDIEAMRDLQAITNLIPILAHADKLDTSSVAEAKDCIQQTLHDNDISYFSFAIPDNSNAPSPTIFAVSSKQHPDLDMMEASVLMSSDYLLPLISSDLDTLVSHLFSPDGSAWLRHTTATKYIRWRRDHPHQSGTNDLALVHRRLNEGYLTPVLTSNPYSRQQPWVSIEVNNWAQGLRHSLDTQYADMHWRMRRSTEDHQQSLAIARRQIRDGSSRCRHSASASSEGSGQVSQDPLGLLELGGRLRTKSRFAVELLSSGAACWGMAIYMALPQQPQQKEMSVISRLCEPIFRSAGR